MTESRNIRLSGADVEARKANIRHFIAKGYTDKEIAAELGVTRNTVIGARHRMGLAGNTRDRPNGEPRKTPVRASKKAPPTPIAPPPVIVEPEPPKAVSEPTKPLAKPRIPQHPIMSLTEYTCRWPEGEVGTEDFRYCLALTPLEQAFCEKHQAMAYQPRRGRVA